MMILCSFISVKAIGPVDVYGELKVKGQSFVGSKNPYQNAIVQVKGLSFFWNQWGGEKFWTADVVDQMVDDYNVEILRVAVATTGGGQVADLRWAIDVIDQCIARGIYIIIDFHSHQAWDEVPEAKAFFKEAVEKYGKYDNLIFEIFNEPITESPHDWTPVKEYADELIGYIRDLGSDNLILVGTPSWCQIYDGIKENPVIDPDNNSAYVMHFYAYSHFVDDDGIGDNFKAALDEGLPFLVSEWGGSHYNGGRGEFTNTFDTESADEWHALLDEYGFSSAMWAINTDGQSSSLWGNEGQGDTYISDLLANWKTIADWRTGNIRPLHGEFLAAVSDVVVEVSDASVEASTEVKSIVRNGKKPYTYKWTKQSGSDLILGELNKENLNIEGLKLGEYRFTLEVVDAEGVTSESEFTISIIEPQLSSEDPESSSSKETVSSETILSLSSSSTYNDDENKESSWEIESPPAEKDNDTTSNLLVETTYDINVSLMYRISNDILVPIKVTKAGNYTLRIHDVLGKQITTQDMKFIDAGLHTLTLDSPIDEGLYVVIVDKY